MLIRRAWELIRAKAGRRRLPASPSTSTERIATKEHGSEEIVDRLHRLTTALNTLTKATTELQKEAGIQSDRNFRSTFKLTMATIIIAIVAAGSGAIQAFIAQSQLDETRNDQRAWLKVSVEPASLVWITSQAGGSSFALTMRPIVMVSNVGHLPAFSMQGSITGTFLNLAYRIQHSVGVKGGTLTAPKVNQADKEANESICNTKITNSFFSEKTIAFPGERYQINQIGGSTQPIKFQWDDNRPFNWTNDVIEKGSIVRPILHGCVTYRLSPAGKLHQTEFTYLLNFPPAANIKYGMVTSGVDVPASFVEPVSSSFLDRTD